jgi:hypothetical protein
MVGAGYNVLDVDVLAVHFELRVFSVTPVPSAMMANKSRPTIACCPSESAIRSVS